jgi:biopolymer transport protein ExbD
MFRRKREVPEINAGAMTDIVFLLLIFFIITSNAVSNKSVKLVLPVVSQPQKMNVSKENYCEIKMEGAGRCYVNGDLMSLNQIAPYVKKFITNNGQNPALSVNPKEAMVLFIPDDDGSTYKNYLGVIGQIQLVYFELWAKNAGVSTDELMAWDVNHDTRLSLKLDECKEKIPYNFTIKQ